MTDLRLRELERVLFTSTAPAVEMALDFLREGVRAGSWRDCEKDGQPLLWQVNDAKGRLFRHPWSKTHTKAQRGTWTQAGASFKGEWWRLVRDGTHEEWQILDGKVVGTVFWPVVKLHPATLSGLSPKWERGQTIARQALLGSAWGRPSDLIEWLAERAVAVRWPDPSFTGVGVS